MTSVPQVPPRPARSQEVQSQPSTMGGMEVPKIPPRPNRRTSERSQSPNRENFPRSPFNEPPGAPQISHASRGGPLHGRNHEISSSDLPQRPPSVALPSVGQEGSEYADINWSEKQGVSKGESAIAEPQETRNVAGDLPLHAPKPSFSSTNAKDRVSMVTRTDSTQADAAGFGKAPTPNAVADDHGPHERTLKPKVSFQMASAGSVERPGSAQAEDEEHGIPEIGQRVPMYPDAGDVQAPSPSPFQQQFPAGIGYHNSGSVKPGRQHRRTPSGRDLLPPGSYGMHGHGIEAADKFEKDWYAKHPDALQREEHGEYGPGIGGGRGEWALSSDDLNKLVRETARTANQAAPQSPGLPNEQFGYMASEEYASRHNATHATPLRTAQSTSSHRHVESPLRKASFPSDPNGRSTTEGFDSSSQAHGNALESETEDETTHMGGSIESTGGSKGLAYSDTAGNPDFHESNSDRGYGVPILAADEVAKTPGVEHMLPAVSPAPDGEYYSGGESSANRHNGARVGSRSATAVNSRPASRHGSIHPSPMLPRYTTHEEDRENMHTPLEDVEEYEPLFPDDEETKVPKRMSLADRLKLREQMKRFPSQDTWEDTPNSAQLQTTVETPEVVSDASSGPTNTTASTFETAEQEAARKGEVSEAEKAKLIPREERLAKSHFKPHIQSEMHRPSIKQRFPSRDIWEDTPDSANLETTVGESPEENGPADLASEAGAVVTTSGSPKDGILAGEQSRDNATVGTAAMVPEQKPKVPARPSTNTLASPTDANPGMMLPPAVPSRPPKRLHQVPPADAQVSEAPSSMSKDLGEAPADSQKPTLPERSKPQVPARPSKPITRDSSEAVPLTKTISPSSAGSHDQADKNLTSESVPKAKPVVPARPTGAKIANLKAGFLGDLESRLKLGPQGPKPQEKAVAEPETEKKPLEDARKSRAKGPAKRKPAAAASLPDSENPPQTSKWQIQGPWTIWQTNEREEIALSGVEGPASATGSEKENTGQIVPGASSPELSEKFSEAKDLEQADLAVRESLQARAPPEAAEKSGNGISDDAIAALNAEPASISRASHASSLPTAAVPSPKAPGTEPHTKMVAADPPGIIPHPDVPAGVESQMVEDHSHQ